MGKKGKKNPLEGKKFQEDLDLYIESTLEVVEEQYDDIDHFLAEFDEICAEDEDMDQAHDVGFIACAAQLMDKTVTDLLEEALPEEEEEEEEEEE